MRSKDKQVGDQKVSGSGEVQAAQQLIDRRTQIFPAAAGQVGGADCGSRLMTKGSDAWRLVDDDLGSESLWWTTQLQWSVIYDVCIVSCNLCCCCVVIVLVGG